VKRNILILGVIAVIVAACTLSLHDKNPKAASFLGMSGSVSGSIANGMLTLAGTNLDNVTSLALTQGVDPTVHFGSFVTHTRSLIAVNVPAALRLPGMLLVSTAAGAAEVELNTLDTLNVDGDLNVGGTADVGLTKTQVPCNGTSGFCVATCPAGKKVVSGGCFISSASNIGFSANYPSGASQWTCRPTAMADVQAYVICGKVALTY
jgi:hypothetical protein